MTNTELQKLFSKMLKVHNNIFDIYIALEDFKDDYKKSLFYSKTKKSIYEAFQLYINSIGGVEYTINLFKNLDTKEFFNILDVVSNSLNFEELIEGMDDSNKQLFTQLLNYLPQE